MRARLRDGLLVVALAPLGACGGRQAQPDFPTFHKDIAPIVWEHCGPCHHPGGPAPFSLLTFDEVRGRARQIVTATQTGLMPPWLPVRGYGSFDGERHLEPAEIERIERWVAQGSLQGLEVPNASPPKWP